MKMPKTVIQMVSGQTFDFHGVPIEAITEEIAKARTKASKQIQLDVEGPRFDALKRLVLYVDHIQVVYLED